MQFDRLAQLLRIPAIAIFSLVLISCGTGDGEDSVDADTGGVSTTGFRLVFEDDFGGPAPAVGARSARGSAARGPVERLESGNWRVDEGYGPADSGWGNDEWQLYRNSTQNLFKQDGSLVLRAMCEAGGVYTEAPATQTIPYARIIDAGVDFGGNPTPSNPNSTAVTPLDGAEVLEVDFQTGGAGYGGAIFEFNPAEDISGFTTLSFGIDTSDVDNYGDLVVQLEDGANVSNVFLSNYTPVSTRSNWSIYEIPLADFGGVNLANATLLGFWNLSSTPGAVNITFGKIYLDGIRFGMPCGKRDDTITSAKIITKDLVNVRYGRIQARIKMPAGAGMWPAFWTLGSDIDERPWPDAGEIDIVEMHYFYSDTSTTHFTTHWSGPRYTPATRPVCASGVLSSLFADEEENCTTATKTFDQPLTDDFHIFEVEWNERQIVGKIDGITYFVQGIDASTMEEFLKDHYLILNVAVGGNLGGPFGPSMSVNDWADPGQTDMLVDWVRVYEAVPPSGATLIDESGNNLPYNRVINSVEFFNGAFVETDLESKAVKADVGKEVMEVTYSNTRSPSGGGVPAEFAAAIFSFNNLDVTPFGTFAFSANYSAFPGININDPIVVTFQDSDLNAQAVGIAPYQTSRNGDWYKYEIPLSAFAGVNLNNINFIGFDNPLDVNGNLIAGTLYFDDIRFAAVACNAVPTVAFDATDYNPATRVGQVTVNDACAAGKLVTVKVDNGIDEIYVGVNLDAAGVGHTVFGLIDPMSVCSTNDLGGYIALEPPSLLASYPASAENPVASAMAFVTDGAPPTSLAGEQLYFYATDPGQTLSFFPDTPGPNGFRYDVFSSGSELDGAFADTSFNPVFQVRSGTGYGGEVAQIALVDFRTGFAAGKEAINFKFKNVGSPNPAVQVQFGGEIQIISLADTSVSTDIGDGWYEISVPMERFPSAASATTMAFTSADPAPAIGNPFYFLITDINLRDSIQVVPDECAGIVTPPPTAPVVGVYSETNTSAMLPYVEIIDAGVSFGGNPTPSNENSTAVTPLDGSNVLAVDFQNGSAGYGGAIFNFASNPVPPNPGPGQGVDLSNYAYLTFGIDTSAVPTFADIVVQLEDGSTAPRVFLSNYTPVSTTGNWSVYEIALADFAGIDLSNVTLLGFWNMSSTAGDPPTILFGTIYLDDINFRMMPLPPPPSPTVGVYSETNTSPSLAYVEIIDAGVSFGGNPTPSNENSTAVTPLDGSNVLAVDFQSGGAGYGGAIFNFGPNPVPPNPAAGDGQDISAYTHLSFGIDTSAVPGFADIIVQLEDGNTAPRAFLSNYTPVSTTGNWSVYEIPLADFAGVDLSSVTLLGFWNMSSTAGDPPTILFGTVYLDDIHFTNDPTPPPPPVFVDVAGVFSETKTSPTIPYVEIIDAGVSFGGNSTPSDENNAEVTPLDGSVVLKVDFVSGLAGYGGAIFNFGPNPVPPNPAAGDGQDISAYTHLSFGIDTSAVPGFADIIVQLEDGNTAPRVFLSNYTPVSTAGNWSVYEIPLADFAGVDLSSVTLLGFWNMSSTAGDPPTLVFGPIYLDDIHFFGPPAGPPAGGNLVTNGDFETGDTSGWIEFPSPAGTISVVADNSPLGPAGSNAVQLSANASTDVSFPAIKVERVGGALTGGAPVRITFDAYAPLQTVDINAGTQVGNVVFNVEFFTEVDSGGAASEALIAPPTFLTDTWTTYTFDTNLGPDASGGISLLFKADCGGNVNCRMDAVIDNVSVVLQ